MKARRGTRSRPTARCWKHPRRMAVACGRVSTRGYCRGCWPASAELPCDVMTQLEAVFWPHLPGDATLWLAA